MSSDPDHIPAPSESVSPRKLAANRANAQLSTGPKTEEGKKKSSLNAVKTGLTGRTVLLPGDDAKAYRRHCQTIAEQLEPKNFLERSLVDSIADTEWRLLRIPVLEFGIYAVGRVQLADQFAHEPNAEVRAALIEAQVFLTYQKQLNALSLQERRLRRQRDEDRAELNRVQELRRRELDDAARHLNHCRQSGEKFDIQEFGFEISKEDVEERAAYFEEQKRLQAEYSRRFNPPLPDRQRRDAA